MFENIKVGDTVYKAVQVGVSIYQLGVGVRIYQLGGGKHLKSFYLPVKVTKTTKTQFTTEDGNRYKKDNGREIGATLDAVLIVDGPDQTKEFIDYKRKCSTINLALNYLDFRAVNFKWQDLTFNDLYDMSVKINNTLSEAKQKIEGCGK